MSSLVSSSSETAGSDPAKDLVQDFITNRFGAHVGTCTYSTIDELLDAFNRLVDFCLFSLLLMYYYIYQIINYFNSILHNFIFIKFLYIIFCQSAAAQANLNEYFGCFTKNGRFLGTDASENWTVDEFYSFSKPHFDNGKAWTFIPKPGSRKITLQTGHDGQPLFASFDELLDSVSFKASSRGSGTCIYRPSNKSWLVLQYHLSFPIPNDLAKKMCLEIADFEKIEDKDSKAKSDLAAKNERELLAMLELEKKGGGGGGGKKKGGSKGK